MSPSLVLPCVCNLLALACTTCLHLPALALPRILHLPLGKEKALRIEIAFIIYYHLVALLHFNPIINSLV